MGYILDIFSTPMSVFPILDFEEEEMYFGSLGVERRDVMTSYLVLYEFISGGGKGGRETFVL